MNETAQVLKQTNRERKVAGYGAHHKKGGSAVSKLGNKPMSWQEINRKHGECKEYDLGGFMDYETFKKMDPDLEAEYVNKLCEKFHVRHEQVSKYLFELGENDLMARLKIKGVDKKIAKIKASDVSDDAIKDFRDQIDFWRQKTEAAKIIDLSEAQRKRDIIENAEFISYEEYQKFSDAEKLNYINNLVDHYNVGRSVISKTLFAKGASTLDQYFYTKNLKSSLHMTRPCAPAERQEKTKVFTEAVKAWRGESVVDKKPEPVIEPVKEEPTSVTTPETVAHDILAAIIGEEKPVEETPVAKSVEAKAPEEKSESTELPESNISDFYIPVKDDADDLISEEPEASKNDETNRHTMVFTSNYRSIGLDSDELEGMKIMCKNKLVEVCITIRTI